MTGPAREVAAVRLSVGAALADLPDDALVLVACSGGPDSLALAAGLAWWATRPERPGSTVGEAEGGDGAEAERPRRRAGAVVVDHGLQPGSDEVAAAAARACAGMGLDPVEVVRVDVGSGPGGPEARARAARYDALAAAAQRHGAAAVVLGHTMDDQAEQVLLALARGSGARSLSGMPPRRGIVRRPLLGLPRSVTVAACEALGLEPWQDPTNADPTQLRARVRTHLLPLLEEGLGPGVAAALARSAHQLREDADVLDVLAADVLRRAVGAAATAAQAEAGQADQAGQAPAPEVSGAGPAGPDAGPVAPRDDPAGIGSFLGPTAPPPPAQPTASSPSVDLDVATLAGSPPALRKRALRAAAVRAGAPAGSLSAAHVAAMEALVVAYRGQGPAALPGRVEARRSYGRLSLVAGPR